MADKTFDDVAAVASQLPCMTLRWGDDYWVDLRRFSGSVYSYRDGLIGEIQKTGGNWRTPGIGPEWIGHDSLIDALAIVIGHHDRDAIRRDWSE